MICLHTQLLARTSTSSVCCKSTRYTCTNGPSCRNPPRTLLAGVERNLFYVGFFSTIYAHRERVSPLGHCFDCRQKTAALVQNLAKNILRSTARCPLPPPQQQGAVLDFIPLRKTKRLGRRPSRSSSLAFCRVARTNVSPGGVATISTLISFEILGIGVL